MLRGTFERNDTQVVGSRHRRRLASVPQGAGFVLELASHGCSAGSPFVSADAESMRILVFSGSFFVSADLPVPISHSVLCAAKMGLTSLANYSQPYDSTLIRGELGGS